MRTWDANPNRPRLKREMSAKDICVLLAEGDKNVLKLLELAASVDPNLLLDLDCMKMRGEQIWQAFYGYSSGWFKIFKANVETRNQDMIDFVNRKIPHLKAIQGIPRYGIK